MGTRGNEGKACDAVVRLLELQSGYRRSGIRHPEKDRHGPPVDLCLWLGTQEYALEHTCVAPYEHEMETAATLEEINTYVRKNLPSLPGPGYYVLVVPVDVVLPEKRKKKRLTALQHLVDWIDRSAGAMQEGNCGRGELGRNPYRCDACVREKLAHFDRTFQLSRWTNAANRHRSPGSLELVRERPNELALEKGRQNRLNKALFDKCPKLQECKRDGARTVLVLESDDRALTYSDLVGNALAKELPEYTDAVDDIFLVETASPDISPRWWQEAARDVVKWC